MASLRRGRKVARIANHIEKIFLIVPGTPGHHSLELLELAHTLVEFGDGISWLGENFDVTLADLANPIGHRRNEVFEYFVAGPVSCFYKLKKALSF